MRAFGPGQSIIMRTGEPFAVELDEPGATGYLFEPHFDPAQLRLEEVERRPSTVPGAASRTRFVFVALAPGSSCLIFRLSAPWDVTSAREIAFLVQSMT
jgi:Chagasin family peptidase inhibitor I42